LGKKVTEQKKSILIFSTNFAEIFLIIRRIQRDTINAHRSSCKVTVIRIGFLWNINYPDRLSRETQIQNIQFNKNL